MDNKYGHEEINKMASPDNWEIWPAPKNEEVIYQCFPEFSCKCPRSGYPDFAKIHLIIVPDEKVLEMKCLKLWLNSYRDKGISHENATQEIADTLFNTLSLKYIYILMEYTPRGNLTTFPMTKRMKLNWELSSMKDEVAIIKRRLLEKVC